MMAGTYKLPIIMPSVVEEICRPLSVAKRFEFDIPMARSSMPRELKTTALLGGGQCNSPYDAAEA